MTKLFLIFSALIFSLMSFAAEDSLYNFSWLDKDKEIYVLQNRKFRKDDQLYVGFSGVRTLNGAFIDSVGVTGRGGYFFSEDWGIELVYGKNFGTENNTAKGVREQGTVPYYRKIDTYMGGMLMWSPFYSKINTFNHIFYYDLILGAGVANVTTLDNRNRFDTGSSERGELTSESNIGGIWNTGVRFYINQDWSVRIDFTGIHYQADKTRKLENASSTTKTKQMFSAYDLGLGLNYTF